MSDDPAPRPAAPRRQQPLADAETLVDMGVLEEQPQPPPDVPPEPPVEEQANAVALDEALAEAGVTKNAEDSAALAELAKLDPATIEAITAWVKHKKKDPPVKK
ncbi:hypothetical protein [Streptomyces xanthophaeus]|uniref:hypothetical protein n=1 Tax=Streptomyces xanthophaeus TaxID=67385 RepID=UPI0037226026